MPDVNDKELVREFVREKSEAAFAALVRQHLNLVFATALRQIGDHAVAEEITQTVFVALAQSAGKLGSHPTIAGWLHQTALNKSREWLRSELRRRRREQIAVELAEARAEGDSIWSPLVPLLDEALLQLRDADRAAVLMHFMEGRTFQEVGSILGIGEDTARKRVDRCLEQLTKFFQRRGFTISTLSSTAPLFAMASHTAPTGLATSAISAGFAAHSTSASTLTLKGVLKIMAWTKAKAAIITTAVVLISAGVTPYVWKYHLSPDAWQNRFHATYHLRKGELLRYIAPPYIPERMTYYKTDDPSQYQAIPSGPNMALFTQDKQGKLHRTQYTFGPKQFPLYLVIQTGFHLKRYEFEGPNNLLNLPLNGDWILSDEITNRETLFTLLEPILYKATKHHIIFKKQSVERDAIVVRGDSFNVQPLNKIQLYAENPNDNSYEGYGNLDELLDAVSSHLNMPLINETGIKPDALGIQSLTWVNHRDSDVGFAKKGKDELTDELLKNLANQTGLTFAREKRMVDVWFVTEQK